MAVQKSGEPMSRESEKENLLRRLQEIIEELNNLESEARQLGLFDDAIVTALEQRIDKLEAAISAVALVVRKRGIVSRIELVWL